MERTKFSKAHRIALAALAVNLVLFALLAAVLPQVILPIPALMLPLLTAAVVESLITRAPRVSARKVQPRATSRMPRALQHAA